MTSLVIAEHDNKVLKDATAKTVQRSHAVAGAPVHVLVAGDGLRCRGPVKPAPSYPASSAESASSPKRALSREDGRRADGGADPQSRRQLRCDSRAGDNQRKELHAARGGESSTCRRFPEILAVEIARRLPPPDLCHRQCDPDRAGSARGKKDHHRADDGFQSKRGNGFGGNRENHAAGRSRHFQIRGRGAFQIRAAPN